MLSYNRKLQDWETSDMVLPDPDLDTGFENDLCPQDDEQVEHTPEDGYAWPVHSSM